MKHLALIAPMLSGKTTAADYLVAAHGYRKIALADRLKDDAAWLLAHWCESEGFPALDRRAIDADKAAFRPFLQWFGTDFVRRWLGRDDYWVQAFLREARRSEQPVVCDDCRFPNEADALAAAGFMLVRIDRAEWRRGRDIVRRMTDQGLSGDALDAELGRVMRHPSETSHRGIATHLTLRNDAGIAELHAALDRVVGSDHALVRR
jgi:hypothetical protein